MEFLRSDKECNRVKRIFNEQFKTNLHVYLINVKVDQHKHNQKEHLQRMQETRVPKMALSYKNQWEENLARPLKRWNLEPEEVARLKPYKKGEEELKQVMKCFKQH